ncbi:sensor histidine kinase [Phaeacidiphilus oryzae]|uniref:sensor histidine kinase n=1 Tax=Phaeacidiphilus oryzae TaxID=348818 RepID=UPI00056B5CF7|nr:HAMP domain-containing sensor histidine kinase [Phaeacidiphilus oryzae]
MRTRLLGILLALMLCVLAALGVPLALSEAAAQQQRVVVDRIDDAARFAALAQYALTDAQAAAALRAEISRYRQVYGIRAGVFAADGHTMAAAPAGWRAPDAASAAAYGEALDGRRSANPGQVWPWQHHRSVVVASPVVRDGDVVAVVVTESPPGPMSARILHGWLLLAAGLLVALLVAVAAAVLLTGWVLRPVRDLDRVAHDIATGSLDSRVAPGGGPPELRRLARGFNTMADHVESVLEQQRAFVADASHQLRNPLAALMLRIEALGMDLPDEADEELGGVREEGQRLARVLDDLLGLAVAENARPELVRTDVAGLVAERVQGWQAMAERRGVALGWKAEPASVRLDPVGIGSALDAVLDNAIKFTPDGGEVRVTVRRGRDGAVEITVADEGPGLDPEELQRIGSRFWRSPRHLDVEGSGLGLSIARTLLAASGGRLLFAQGTPTGLAVTLRIPRNP